MGDFFPTPVVPLGEGGSAFAFTMFQAPGQPDEQFEDQYLSLLREFENLESLSAEARACLQRRITAGGTGALRAGPTSASRCRQIIAAVARLRMVNPMPPRLC